MKATTRTVALIGAGLLLLPLCIWAMLGQPWTYKSRVDIDINSGDLRHRVHVLSLVVSSEIQESDLSREVRKVGIGVPAERVWKRMGESHLVQNRSIDCVYGSVFMHCAQLLCFLDETNAPDEDRRAVMERLMTSLRTGEPRLALEESRLLMAEIAEKHDLHGFSPQFEAYIRELRDARSRENQP